MFPDMSAEGIILGPAIAGDPPAQTPGGARSEGLDERPAHPNRMGFT